MPGGEPAETARLRWRQAAAFAANIAAIDEPDEIPEVNVVCPPVLHPEEDLLSVDAERIRPLRNAVTIEEED